jgi:hypothetical protein
LITSLIKITEIITLINRPANEQITVSWKTDPQPLPQRCDAITINLAAKKIFTAKGNDAKEDLAEKILIEMPSAR